MSIVRSIACCALILAAPMPAARAELPPTVYRDFQQRAEEALTIRVVEVFTQIRDGTHADEVTRVVVYKVRAKAVVEAVRRSASSLKRGATIDIVYDRVELPAKMVGARPIPILKQGMTVPAFLNRLPSGEAYTVAAQGASFEPDVK